MPTRSFAYPFEFKIGQWAGDLAARGSLPGQPRPMVLKFDAHGQLETLRLGPLDLAAERVEPARVGPDAFATAPDKPCLIYYPVDGGLEHTWLAWHGLDQATVERLLGQAFHAGDFQPVPMCAAWARPLPGSGLPSTWGVLF